MWPHTHQTTWKFAEKLASGMPAPAFTCLILKRQGSRLRPMVAFCNRVIQLALPFLLHMRNIKRQTKQKRNKMPLLVWAAQRGPFIRSDRDANKLVRAALLRNQSWFRDTVTAQRCEIQREAFEFAAQWIYILLPSGAAEGSRAGWYRWCRVLTHPRRSP